VDTNYRPTHFTCLQSFDDKMCSYQLHHLLTVKSRGNTIMMLYSGVPSTSAARGDDLKCRHFGKNILWPVQKNVIQLA